ncbi:nucleotidyltransferase family protein [Priestia flexa]|uniref:nucleotidyltransferase domain-containing protein n=1 Tax=Priestia flexa TaxID=86664 RepID=UPI000C241464|nr:nucleotidyltransferase family protein [Priestia flexa]MEC0664811.1 nucleotidyltransferase family protein [Priestia flexa]
MIHTFIQQIYMNQPLAYQKHDYQKLLNEIEKDAMSSQVYCLLKKYGKLEEIPLDMRNRLEQIYKKIVFQNLIIKKEKDDVLKALTEFGIAAIVLKGTSFAERYYGHIGARPTSDIDVLLKPDDLAKAKEIVISMGFNVENEPIEGHFHITFSKYIPGSIAPLMVELHWDILRSNTSVLNIEEFWAASIPEKNNPYLRKLDPQHEFYMICLHGWRHNLDAAKYFLDIIQMCEILKGKIDIQKMLTDSKQHHTRKRLEKTLSIVHQTYPELEHLSFYSAINHEKYKLDYYVHRHTKVPLIRYIDRISHRFFNYDLITYSFKEIKKWCIQRYNNSR